MPPPDPRELLARAPLSPAQVLVIVIAVALNGLDGFDVLAISFASPGIAKEWGIDRAGLGIVLTMELVGMGLGALVLGAIADKLGRRPLALGCLVTMSLGMLLCSTAHEVVPLCLWRVLTGFGIGGMLATTNALAAEFANDRRRTIALAWTVIGYPIGAVILGWIVSQLLANHDWRIVFQFGAAVTLALIPVVWFTVPESVHWLVRTQPTNALRRVNGAMTRLGHPAVTELPPREPSTGRIPVAELFVPGLANTTVLLTLATFLHMTTFYFILKWVPKIVVDMGYAPPLAAKVLVWANLGGALGGAVFGWLAARVGLKALSMMVMLAGGVMVILFGRGQSNLGGLAAICAIAGFFTNAAIVGLYSMLALYYPTHLRATGTGFGIGLGRAGAALSPVLAGFLFKSGMNLTGVAVVMAGGTFLAALALVGLKGNPVQR